jgi:hypothetical protein
MNIVIGNPPNIEAIKAKFDLTGKDPVFAYGDTLYNPAGNRIEEHLMVHEETHERQQKEMGVEAWWDKYLVDAEFRVLQELEAYGNQYRFVTQNFKDRNAVARFLHLIASDLSGAMYGNAIQYGEAIIKIKRAAR